MNFNELPELPFTVSTHVLEKASQVKLAIFDVDGVLTDGRLYYGKKGETLKVFHALDGHGLKMLELAGITVGVITARKSAALTQRLQDLKISHVYMGVADKLAVFNELITELDVPTHHCAFTGDDVIDLGVMQQCGFKCSVSNGHFIVKQLADWVSPLQGGQGAVRSICDLILYSQKIYPLGSLAVQ